MLYNLTLVFLSQCLPQINLSVHITQQLTIVILPPDKSRGAQQEGAEANACPFPFVLIMTHPHFLTIAYEKSEENAFDACLGDAWTGRAHAHSVGTINARADTLS